MEEKLLGLADIARAQGISRERVRQKLGRTLILPPADFRGPRDDKLWRRSTLEKARVPGF